MEGGSTEIGRQRSEKRRIEQARSAPGRPPGRPMEEAGRPACTSVHRKERSTGLVDRLTRARSRLGAVDRADRPWNGSVDRPVDRQARLDFSFRIRIPFLDGIESNLGFHKSRDSVAINRGKSPHISVSYTHLTLPTIYSV